MYRTILLLTTVVLAGCLGGVGTQSSTGPPAAAWADGESIDTAELADHHFGTLREAGSFTVNRSETIRVDGDARPDDPRPDGYYPPSFSRHRVNLDETRYLGTFVTAGHRRSTHFVTSEITATRRRECPSCDPTFDYRPRPEGDTRSERIDRFRTEEAVDSLARSLRGVTAGFNYTYAGTVDRDGETLYRYRAARNLSTAPPPFSEPPRGTATVLVTADGVVRHFDLQYAGPATVSVDSEAETVNVTQRFVWTYTAVGETPVERPTWVDRAAEEAPPRRTETGER